MDAKAIYTNAYIAYGEKSQLIVALEELSECQKEICKFLRDSGNINHLSEEVADALIMLEQVQLFFGIEDCVANFREMKLRRLDQRLKGV